MLARKPPHAPTAPLAPAAAAGAPPDYVVSFPVHGPSMKGTIEVAS